MKKKKETRIVQVVPDLYMWVRNLKFIGQDNIIVSITVGDTTERIFYEAVQVEFGER